jgi:hypothetical protein
LHYLAHGNLDIITLLLSSGTVVDSDILNSNDGTPFDVALDNGRLDVARSLAEWMGSGNFQGWPPWTRHHKSIPNDAKPSPGSGSALNIPDE